MLWGPTLYLSVAPRARTGSHLPLLSPFWAVVGRVDMRVEQAVARLSTM